MSARRRRGGGGGVSILYQLMFLVLVITAAVIAIAFVLSPGGPFRPAPPPTPAPISIGQIQKAYKLQTAEVTGSTIVEGETNSALPFSKAKLTYQIFVTLTAGIDMMQLKDSDVRPDGETLTIVLPDPQILGETSEFVPVAETKEIFSGPSEKKELPKIVVDEGKKRVRTTIIEQGKLLKDARINAEDELRNLVLQIAPQYKRVVFIQNPSGSPTVRASPSPSGPPR